MLFQLSREKPSIFKPSSAAISASSRNSSKLLTPVALAGILLLVPGGLILFIADAGPLAANRILQIKFVLIALGVLNAILFRLWWQPKLARWDRLLPPLGRAQAMLSIAIWLAVPTAGRLIAYL